jgi:hypothetical protein
VIILLDKVGRGGYSRGMQNGRGQKVESRRAAVFWRGEKPLKNMLSAKRSQM